MLEKRFLDLLEQYKEKTKNIKLTPNIIQRMKYIQNCLDHLENEIDDLNLDLEKPEYKLYENLQKELGPLILAYIVLNS